MSDIQEEYDKIRKDLSARTDAFGSMTLDGVYQAASNLLIAHYLERLINVLEKRG
tara:strand:- start:9452 stop:9616 length:165 start_codon:yes stop_codon:yes gene_type:complete